MKTLTVTEVSRNFSRVLDGVERNQEEVVLVRNHKQIARLIPEPPSQNALEVLGDLYRTMDDGTAEALADGIKRSRNGKTGTLSELLTANAKDFRDVPGLKWVAVDVTLTCLTVESLLEKPSRSSV